MSKKNFYKEEFEELCKEIATLFYAKNQDYGNSFFCNGNEVAAVLPDLERKMVRIRVLFRKGKHEVRDETLEDSLKDLSIYSLMAIILKRKIANAKQM